MQTGLRRTPRAGLPAALTLMAVVLGLPAGEAQTLSVVGERLALDGQPRFLLFVSYFHGLERPPETLATDLAWLASKGVGGIRVWPNATSPRLMNTDGSLDSTALTALIRVIGEAAKRRLVVDVTFHREALCQAPESCGLTAANYRAAIVAVAKALRDREPRRANVLFDLQNEWNVSGRAGLTFADLTATRDAVKAVDSSLAVTASTSGTAHPEAAAHAFDLLAYHEGRDRAGKWAVNTSALIAGLRRALEAVGKGAVPIYLQEPNRFRVDGDPETYYDNDRASYVTAATQARDAGAAAWTFHTAASFNLASTTPFADLLQPGEREALERLAIVADARER